MKIVVMLYYLGNNDKKKSLCVVSTEAAILGLTPQQTSATTRLAIFFSIFNAQLVEFTNREPLDVKCQL